MAEYSVNGNIAIIKLSNGKLNPLSESVRTGIKLYLKKALDDQTVEAIVLRGSEKHFSVGADISEFGGDSIKTHLGDVCDEIEASRKPVVAAIHGYALGGGFEIALSCHYRVASSDAVVGFPEVKLGILPGAGGTQRFPRIAGLDAAMQWITTGKQYSANTAAKLDVIDRIISKGTDVIKESIAFARIVATKSLLGKRSADRRVKDTDCVDEIAAKYTQIVHKKSRGQYAPIYCIEAVRYAAQSTLAEGLKKESEIISMLGKSGQAIALRYAFFAERQVQKWSVPGSDISWHNSKPMPVKLGAVIGLGTMGRGIVMNFLLAGVPVIVIEMNEKFLSAGMKSVHALIDDMERHQKITKQQNAMMKKAVTGTLNYNDLKNVDLVIEAVFEEISLKEKVFKALDNACKPSAILASNTSALDIDKIASFTRRPEKVMGMHFFAPANLMRLLENVMGSKTSSETIATCMDMGKRMGKVTVLVGNCYGFVANRMYFNYKAESWYLVEEGSLPVEVDKAVKDYGFAMGAFVVDDLSGLDLGYRMRTAFGLTPKQQIPGTQENVRSGLRYCPLPDYLVEVGRYGLKTKKGWYDYPNGRIPVESGEVSKIISDYRSRIGATARKIDHEEVIERLVFALVNEGFKVLDDGIAASPMDIDMIWIHGYAFPSHTGGPMHYASKIGLSKVLARIRHYYEKFGNVVPQWTPSPMLERIVEKRGDLDMSQWMQYSSATKTKSNL
uniref:peroxisomal bifunctional enzyme-like n=1 Tax=Styela clava TaxID=7725 RepID=UPI001939A6E4|nr:peroxisomal bifunctional enzyme-like [Styela clava]